MSRERRFAVVYACLWAVMILMYWGLLLIQTNGYLGRETVVAAVRLSVVPGVLGTCIWYLSGRVPWPECRPTKFLLTHAFIAAAFAVVTAAWFTLPLLGGVRGLDRQLVVHSILPWQISSGLFMYGLIAGISYAIRGAWGARDLRLATERAERLQAQAELAALRAHINPHFLFNTLHSVTQLLRSDPSRAEAALDRLSDLFRYALRLDRERVELVSLEDEWKFSESYLWLEQMRMGDRLRVECTISEDALLATVPPFTLQPLIENAVRHGLSPKVGIGTLRIFANEGAGILHIRVSDDGVGAAPDVLANSAGIGLRAVRQRLEARHQAAARMMVTGSPGAGVNIELWLPLQFAT